MTDDNPAKGRTVLSSLAPAAPGFRRLLALLLAALLLVSLGLLIWAVAERQDADGRPFRFQKGHLTEAQRSREEVMARAEQFMLRANTYGPDLLEGKTMPDYRQRVQELITAKHKADFEAAATIAEQQVTQFDYERTAEVFGTGVASIDADSATALVSGAIANQLGDQEPRPAQVFRVEVRLVKFKGEWLVDEFEPVTEGTS